MVIRKIELENFRQYQKQEVLFSNNMNIIVGNNAAGKTTILEAIHLVSTTRSFKNVKDNELIRKKANFGVVAGVFEGQKTSKKAIVLISNNFKKMSLDNDLVRKSSEYVGFCKVVSFSNSDVYALLDSPNSRRKLLDFMLSQIDQVYLKALKDYKKLVKEKNIILKKEPYPSKKELLLVEVLNEKIFELSQYISKKKIEALTSLNKSFKQINLLLSKDKEIVEVELKQSLPYGITYNEYCKICSNDMKYKSCLYGPHKDDLIFKINGDEAIKVASQGQLKTMMISFKLAFSQVLKEKNGENPIVLLDDVFGELDADRQNSIINLLNDGIQVIITTPSLNEINLEMLKKANIIKLNKEENI